ncbi:MAG: cytochrome c oxidase assembly protein [Pseudonocardia sp.]|nr:cytochrome c oxidase assembly protein [Pseudonocardia sp.]
MPLAEPTLLGLLTTWTFAPVGDALILLGVLAYAYGVRRVHTGGGAWPVTRSAAGAGAVVGLVVALNSAMAVYGHALFWVHMIQHLILIMVVPVLLVWAQPIRLAHDAGAARAVDAALRNPAVRFVTHPVVALALYTAVLVLTHLTAFQARMPTTPWMHEFELVAYLISGYLFFLPLAGDERAPWDVPYMLRLAVLAVGMGADTLVGIALMLTGHPIADFSTMRGPWGLNALADQHTAGGIMWALGDGLMMLLMIVVGVRWGLARPERQTMGPWLEGARTRALLDDPEADTDADTDRSGQGVDDDEDALARYNARLAALHGLDRPRDPDPRPPA